MGTPGSISLSTWYKFKIVRDGTSVSIYIDDIQVGTTQTLDADNDQHLTCIGAQKDRSYEWDGYLKNIKIWDENGDLTVTWNTIKDDVYGSTRLIPALSDKTTDALGEALTHIQNSKCFMDETTIQMPDDIYELMQADRSDKLYDIVTRDPVALKMYDLNVVMGEFYIKKETNRKWSTELILIKSGKILTDAENARLLRFVKYDLSKWIEIRAGTGSVTTAGTTITLSSAILYKSYALFIRCFDGSGNNIDFSLTDKVNGSFKVTPAINGTVDYLAILNLNQELEMRTGSRPTVTTGTVVAFPELPSTNYRVVIRCFDSNGDNVDFALTGKATTGFTITPAVNATVEYIAIIDETTNIRVGSEAVTTGGTAITFNSTMASTNYATGIRCFDGSGNNIDFTLTNKTVNGFTITSAINGTIDYIAIINQ